MDRENGVIERSSDGVTYKRFFDFYRETTPDDQVTDLLVGKVPFNGQPQNYEDPGELGGMRYRFRARLRSAQLALSDRSDCYSVRSVR